MRKDLSSRCMLGSRRTWSRDLEDWVPDLRRVSVAETRNTAPPPRRKGYGVAYQHAVWVAFITHAGLFHLFQDSLQLLCAGHCAGLWTLAGLERRLVLRRHPLSAYLITRRGGAGGGYSAAAEVQLQRGGLEVENCSALGDSQQLHCTVSPSLRSF